jgi:putative DNA primase/helicase
MKQLTGGDRIKARMMRCDFFDFEPTHKLFVATNHRPIVRSTDLGTWRRIRLVPLTVTIPENEQDRTLLDQLKKELPGIMAWAVQGCLTWQKDGLGMPTAVKDATHEYKSDMDVIGSFLSERCKTGCEGSVQSERLYDHYRSWCEDAGERPVTHTRFSLSLKERGFENRKIKGKMMWIGISLDRNTDGE